MAFFFEDNKVSKTINWRLIVENKDIFDASKNVKNILASVNFSKFHTHKIILFQQIRVKN